MKRSIFLAVFAILGFIYSANAQEMELPDYQRSSLHMVLLTTDEPNIEGSEDFSAILEQTWQEYPFPEKYNEHKIDVNMAYGGQPKWSYAEAVNKAMKAYENMDILKLIEVISSIQDIKKYNDSLTALAEDIVAKEKMGNQLIRKWFNIQDDGSWNYDLIMERAAYNATQADIAEAQILSRGTQAIFDQGEDLISNTFVTFSKLSFYKNEPAATLIYNALSRIINQAPEYAFKVFEENVIQLPDMAKEIALKAYRKKIEETYNSTKNGYTAKTTTAIYQLVWNDEVRATFYDMFEGDKINMEKFNAYTFPMTIVGTDTAKSITIDKKVLSSEALIKETIIRNIDKLFAKMQKEFQVFATVSQIISTDPLIADIGMKEGLEGDEKFVVIEPKFDPKTCKFEWSEIGTKPFNRITIEDDMIWDNRYSLIDEANGEKPAEEPAIKGTVFSKHKQARRGMLIRQVK